MAFEKTMSDGYDHEDYEMSPRSMRRLGKKKFYVCDEHGECVKVVWNKFPAGAAGKGVTEGLTKILVLDPSKNGGKGKWYGYIGKKLKIRAKDLTEHQKMYGMKYKTKVYRHELPDVASAAAPLWSEDEEFAEYY